jgi:hypothetical protein
LQQAIEGNKREGRRSSYGTYPDMMMTTANMLSGLPPMPPGGLSPMSPMALSGSAGGRHAHFNGNGHKMHGKKMDR